MVPFVYSGTLMRRELTYFLPESEMLACLNIKPVSWVIGGRGSLNKEFTEQLCRALWVLNPVVFQKPLHLGSQEARRAKSVLHWPVSEVLLRAVTHRSGGSRGGQRWRCRGTEISWNTPCWFWLAPSHAGSCRTEARLTLGEEKSASGKCFQLHRIIQEN